MRIITLDLETRNFFQDVGSNDPTALDISVVCIHDSETDKFYSYTMETLRELWPFLEQADALVTWNGDHFDIPLLNKYYPGDLAKIKSIDLMKEVQTVLGRRLKLDSVASATLGVPKSANGYQAVQWWNEGQIQKIIDYCVDDVKLTRDLYEFIVDNGYIKFEDAGKMRELKLDTRAWESPSGTSLTYTLPF